MGKLPLEGVRVLDLCVIWAGPFGCMQMADLGAEVIRVESMQYTYTLQRGNPFPARSLDGSVEGAWQYPNARFGEKPWNRYAPANYYLRNKLGMTVDLNRPEGREVFRRLVEVSDGVLENQAVRNMDRLGLGYETLREWNPRIIMVRSNGFGLSGPYKTRLGYGNTMEGITGFTSLRHYPDLPPYDTSGVLLGDAIGGSAMAAAFLQALHYRERSGKGQLIEMAQTENLIDAFAPAYVDYFMNGRVQRSIGNRDTSMVQGCYLCDGDDEWCVISVESDEQWRSLCAVIERPELADDPRFSDVLSRHQNHDEIDGYLWEWTVVRSQYEVMHKLQAAGIPAGPVINNHSVHQDLQLQARGMSTIVEHPEAGTHKHLGPIYQLSETPCRMGVAPLLGEHNNYIYKELLGYSDEEIEFFVREQHIGDYYLPGAK